MHHGHMHRGYVHHGYIIIVQDLWIQQSESRIHASWTHLSGSHSLSARRAWRTKSSRPKGPKANPKGHQLEVGARRAPKLLVHDIFVGKCTFLWTSFVWRKIGSKMLNVEKNYEYHMCVLETFDLKINLCFYLRFDLFKVWSNKAFQKKVFKSKNFGRKTEKYRIGLFLHNYLALEKGLEAGNHQIQMKCWYPSITRIAPTQSFFLWFPFSVMLKRPSSPPISETKRIITDLLLAKRLKFWCLWIFLWIHPLTPREWFQTVILK